VDDQKRDEEQACNSHENFLPIELLNRAQRAMISSPFAMSRHALPPGTPRMVSA
jgi:hypothetical protein